MIKTTHGLTTITCDKCGKTSVAPDNCYNDLFFDEGWCLHRGRKYMHLCRKCQPKKSRDAMDFVKDKFGSRNEIFRTLHP